MIQRSPAETVARANLLSDIARLADHRASDMPRDRDGIAVRLRAQVARLTIGDQVRINLMMIAATALLALERHDELQRPAPAAAAKIREPRMPEPWPGENNIDWHGIGGTEQ